MACAPVAFSHSHVSHRVFRSQWMDVCVHVCVCACTFHGALCATLCMSAGTTLASNVDCDAVHPNIVAAVHPTNVAASAVAAQTGNRQPPSTSILTTIAAQTGNRQSGPSRDDTSSESIRYACDSSATRRGARTPCVSLWLCTSIHRKLAATSFATSHPYHHAAIRPCGHIRACTHEESHTSHTSDAQKMIPEPFFIPTGTCRATT